MKELVVRVGAASEDADILLSGFRFCPPRAPEPSRQVLKEFRFQVPRAEKGATEVQIALHRAVEGLPIAFFSEGNPVGELPAGGPGSAEVTLSLPEGAGWAIIQGVVAEDPLMPPMRPVTISTFIIRAKEGDLALPEEGLPARIERAPLKVIPAWRCYNEQRKYQFQLGGRVDQYQYSGEKNVYFGDVHVHTEYSMCGYPNNGSIEHNVRVAKERGLDFIALADHAEHMDLAKWESYYSEIERCSREYELPIIPAIEWTSFEWGHRNVYFKENFPPYFSSTTFDTNHPKKLRPFFEERGIEAFAAAHHPAYISHLVDFDSIDDEFEPLIEIYSTWGNSEYWGAPLQERAQTLPGCFVQDALMQGHRLGFVGGGDVHNTMPGDGGLTAVLAEENTVLALWEAMKQRLCYAVAHQSILLEFTVNGFPMGSVIKVNQYNLEKLFPLRIAGSCVGTGPVEKLEVVSNGEVLYTTRNWEKLTDAYVYVELEKLMTPERLVNKAGVHQVNCRRYFYLRVTQRDGTEAWSSPVFLDYKPEWA